MPPTDHARDDSYVLSQFTGVPSAVRAAGQALDPRWLEPGDLILVSSKKPRFPATSIRSYQSNLYTEDHACWQHVAISAGRFDIIEATAFGVKFCTYWHYMTGDHNIKVRRLANADKATRTMVALYAAAQVRSWYGYSNLSNIAAILAGADAWRKPLITSGRHLFAALRGVLHEGWLLPGELSIAERQPGLLEHMRSSRNAASKVG